MIRNSGRILVVCGQRHLTPAGNVLSSVELVVLAVCVNPSLAAQCSIYLLFDCDNDQATRVSIAHIDTKECVHFMYMS